MAVWSAWMQVQKFEEQDGVDNDG